MPIIEMKTEKWVRIELMNRTQINVLMTISREIYPHSKRAYTLQRISHCGCDFTNIRMFTDGVEIAPNVNKNRFYLTANETPVWVTVIG